VADARRHYDAYARVDIAAFARATTLVG